MRGISERGPILQYSTTPVLQFDSFVLSARFHQKLPSEKLLRAAEFFRFRFDARGGDERLDIFLGDRDRINVGELVDDLAHRCRIAESVLFDDRGCNFFLVVTKKIESTLDGAQHRDYSFRIRFYFLFARYNHHEGESGHNTADVEKSREPFLLELYPF